MTMRLSLIISTYNQPAALAKVLSAMGRQGRQPDEILLADDGSGDPTRQLIDDWRGRARVQVNHVWHSHEGFRKTVILNKAVSAATGEYLVLLDGDCVPHREFIADHIRLAEPGFWVQGRRCFVKEPFVKEFDPARISALGWMVAGRITGAAKGLRLPFPIVRRNVRQRGIIGCNMGFWREDVVSVNGFDEEYAGWGIGEDSDIGTRLYHLGRPRKFVYGQAIVYHLNHPMLPRSHVAASQARLQETLASGKIRCGRGLDQYRPQTAS
jgi:glycosyltransferase involved in cell wall biosynthesis